MVNQLRLVAASLGIATATMTYAGIDSAAGYLLEIKSRTSDAVVKIVKDGETIVCINGLDQFPESSKKIGAHPTNNGVYEITQSARAGGWKGGTANITSNRDYTVLKNATGGEIAKWSVQGNIFSQVPLSVMQVLSETTSCKTVNKK